MRNFQYMRYISAKNHRLNALHEYAKKAWPTSPEPTVYAIFKVGSGILAKTIIASIQGGRLIQCKDEFIFVTLGSNAGREMTPIFGGIVAGVMIKSSGFLIHRTRAVLGYPSGNAHPEWNILFSAYMYSQC